MKTKPAIVLSYIPVIHSGYLKFLREVVEQDEIQELLLLDPEILREWAPTHKDIHALSVEEIRVSLSVLTPELKVRIIENWREIEKYFQERSREEFEVICSDEIVMRGVVDKLRNEGFLEVLNIDWRQVFLRWDKKKSISEIEPTVDELISEREFDQKMMALAVDEGKLSADWWRQVGAVLVRNEKVVLVAHNQHLPHEQQPNVEGDIRSQFHKGEHWDLGTAIHAEAEIIARAAGEGIFIAGAELYVTDFPCPNCAKLIAQSGITKVYYKNGYAVSDGERVLKAAGVSLIQVKAKTSINQK